MAGCHSKKRELLLQNMCFSSEIKSSILSFKRTKFEIHQINFALYGLCYFFPFFRSPICFNSQNLFSMYRLRLVKKCFFNQTDHFFRISSHNWFGKTNIHPNNNGLNFKMMKKSFTKKCVGGITISTSIEKFQFGQQVKEEIESHKEISEMTTTWCLYLEKNKQFFLLNNLAQSSALLINYFSPFGMPNRFHAFQVKEKKLQTRLESGPKVTKLRNKSRESLTRE